MCMEGYCCYFDCNIMKTQLGKTELKHICANVIEHAQPTLTVHVRSVLKAIINGPISKYNRRH